MSFHSALTGIAILALGSFCAVSDVTGADLVLPDRFDSFSRETVCEDSVRGSDLDWDTSFFPPGPHMLDGHGSIVDQLVVYRDELYVFGHFDHVGNVDARDHAMWDGDSWEPMGELPFTISRIGAGMEWNGFLVLGGLFTWGEARTSSLIAVWDGESWSSWGTDFPSGPTWRVHAIAATGSELVVAGWFGALSGTESPSVMRWDGSRWLGLGAGLPGDSPSEGVFGLEVHAGEVLACGRFDLDGSGPASAVALWDGSEWSRFAGAIFDEDGLGSARLMSLRTHEDRLYVAGTIDRVDDLSVTEVAVWDGVEWSALGPELDPGGVPSARVDDLTVFDGDLYAIGYIPALGNVARWSGNRWVAAAEGPDPGLVPRTSAQFGNDLYVGGFQSDQNSTVGAAVLWTGDEWQAIGPGRGAVPHPVRAVVSTPDGLVVSYFEDSYPDDVVHFLAWTGSGWVPYADPVPGQIHALAWFQDQLIAAWTSRDPELASGIASWSGSSWQPLGNGVSGSVLDLEVHGDELFACGLFRDASGVENTRGIARWNGREWRSLSTGISGTPGFSGARVRSWGDDLLFAGLFQSAGDVRAPGLAIWNGESWEAPWGDVPITPAAWVWDAVPWNGGLVARGPFDLDREIDEDFLAFWNGAEWIPIPPPPDLDPLRELETWGSYLVAAGDPKDYHEADSAIMLWDGTCWSRPGSGAGYGTRNSPSLFFGTLEATDEGLVLGGDFRVAGGRPSRNLAIWRGDPGEKQPLSQVRALVLPNPAPGVPRLRLELPAAGELRIEVFDVQGRRVWSDRAGRRVAGVHLEPMAPAEVLTSWPSGLYLTRVTVGTGPGASRAFARWLRIR